MNPVRKSGHAHWAEHISLWLIGLMWVLPFLSPRHQLPIPSFYGELTAFVLGLLALCALLKKEVWQDFQLPRITLLPFGILCLILLQLALGMITYPQMALIGMQYLLWACLLMVLGHRLRMVLGWEKLATTLAWFLVVGGLINVGLVVLQYSGARSLWLFPKLSAQSFGNLGQPNHFANYMALATGSLIYLLTKRRVSWAIFAVSATAFLALLALSGSRSSWLYLTAFFILALFKHRSDRNSESRQLLLVCLALLPSFGVVQLGLNWLLPLLGNQPHIVATERFFQQVSGGSVRLRIWQDALQMFVENPWLGVGYGKFAWNSFLQVANHAPGEFSQPAEHAHNLPLHLIAELGVFAGLLLIGTVWLWLRGAINTAFSNNQWWMWAILSVLGIHSLLEYPLWYGYFLGIVALLLGAGETRFLQADLHRIGRSAVVFATVLGLFSALNTMLDYSKLEQWVQRGTQHRVNLHELMQMKQEFQKLHRESVFASYVTLTFASSLTPNEVMLKEKLVITKNAQHFAPIREIVFRYAVLLAIDGKKSESQEQFKLALKAYPNQKDNLRNEIIKIGLDPELLAQ